jgi:hypothetical protein
MTETRKDDYEVPFGYEPASMMSDTMMGMICTTCAAVVPRRMGTQHSAWHQKLWERIGIS